MKCDLEDKLQGINEEEGKVGALAPGAELEVLEHCIVLGPQRPDWRIEFVLHPEQHGVEHNHK